MSYKITIAGNDASSYITEISDIPVVERNLDYSIVASEFTMEVASTFPNTPAKDNEVLVYLNESTAYPFFVGIIKEAKFNYDERVWETNVAHAITKLKNKTATYANLHTGLADTANNNYYIVTDNQGYPNINALWLMKVMCNIEGIDLNISIPESNSLATVYETKFISSLAANRTFYLSDLKFDENMLYAFNQAEVGAHTIWEAKYSRIALSFTFFDLFSLLMGYMGLTMGWSQSGTVKQLILYLKDNSYVRSFTDSMVYHKETGNIVGDESGVNWVGNFSARSGYDDAVGSAYTEQFTDGLADSNESMDVPTNFLMLYRDSRLSYTDGKVFAYAGGASHESGDGCATYEVMLANKINAFMDDWNTYEVESDINIASIAPLLKVSVNLETNRAMYEGVYQ